MISNPAWNEINSQAKWKLAQNELYFGVVASWSLFCLFMFEWWLDNIHFYFLSDKTLLSLVFHYLCITFISLPFISNLYCQFRHTEGIACCELCCRMHVQFPLPLFLWHIKFDFTTARWDFRSSPQSPPRISVFWWNFELQVGPPQPWGT